MTSQGHQEPVADNEIAGMQPDDDLDANATYLRVASALMLRDVDVVPHRNRTLLAHLRGTFDILKLWNQPRHVCLAGLVHSVYSTDAFSSSIVDFSEREWLRRVVGDRAEELAYLFASVHRKEFLESAKSNRCEISLHNRLTGKRITLPWDRIGELLAIYMANLAEQSFRPDGTPSLWLARCSEIGSIAALFSNEVPTIFDSCTMTMSQAAERELRASYIKYTTSNADEINHDFVSLAEAAPWLPEPLVWIGLVTLASSDAQWAYLVGRRALSVMRSFGATWDRRLSAYEWTSIAKFLEHSGELDSRSIRGLSCAVARALESFSTLPDLYQRLAHLGIPSIFSARDTSRIDSELPWQGSFREQTLFPKRFQNYLSGFSAKTGSRLSKMNTYPDLSSNAVYDPTLFPLAVALEQAAPKIIEEFWNLDQRNFHRESERISRVGSWDVLMLLERGKPNLSILQECPTITEILLAGSIQTLSGLSYFSRLAPGTKIAEHCGPTNLRLRCHLGIKTPAGAGLRVGGVDLSWSEGKCLIFNDALPHEAWNDGDQDRIVLIVDLWHPDLTAVEIELLEGLQRYAFSHAENLTKYWAKNDAARNRDLALRGSTSISPR